MTVLSEVTGAIWKLTRLIAPLLLLSACDTQPPEPVDEPMVEIFHCHGILIGIDGLACTEDFQGPGQLTLAIRPDPLQSSWEVAVKGLVVLAETCAFHGSFDQTRLSALQGRGEVELVCPLAADLDRAYHELSVTSREETPNTALAVSIRLKR